MFIYLLWVMLLIIYFFVFFFSSRRRHTRCALVMEFRRVLFRSNARARSRRWKAAQAKPHQHRLGQRRRQRWPGAAFQRLDAARQDFFSGWPAAVRRLVQLRSPLDDPQHRTGLREDRQSAVVGTGGPGRVASGGGRKIKKKKN